MTCMVDRKWSPEPEALRRGFWSPYADAERPVTSRAVRQVHSRRVGGRQGDIEEERAAWRR